MFDHAGLKVSDLKASVRFYRAALAPLGYVLCAQDDASASLGPKDAPALYLSAGGPSRAVHLALKAKDRASVTAFHRAGLDAGGRDHGPPGLRADYAPTYYAAFLTDPDGNNIEAVCMTTV